MIGEVTDTGHMVLEWNGEVAADIPLGPLADDAPLYDRPHMSLDDYKAWAQVKPLGDVPESTDIAADLLKLLGSPNIASRRWIYEQYDQQVGGDTVQRPGGDAAVVRVHGSKKALAMTAPQRPRHRRLLSMRLKPLLVELRGCSADSVVAAAPADVERWALVGKKEQEAMNAGRRCW